MRIWSIHPKYLDAKGLVALWRETLLAKKVLENKTKGYKNHPQLERFKNSPSPLDAINYYLSIVFDEASARNYNFDKEKINWNFKVNLMKVTQGQINYEMEHLKCKLKLRDPEKFKIINTVKIPDPHSIFSIIKGQVEAWEKV
jgi:hypothetical protein